MPAPAGAIYLSDLGELVHKDFGTITSGIPLVLALAASGFTGMAHLVCDVPASTTLKIELSQDGAAYFQYASNFGVGTVNVAIPFESVNPTTHVRLTRMSGTGAIDYSVSDGPVAWYALQQSSLGKLRTRTLVTVATDYVIDPTADCGVTWKKYGIDNETITIRNEAVAPWDATQGDPMFAVWRLGNGLIAANPPSTGNVDWGTVANQAAMVALTSGATHPVVNDACYRTDAGRYYVLTTAPYSVAGNWTALPVASSSSIVKPIVTIKNVLGVEAALEGAPVAYLRAGVNYWITV